MCAPEFEHTVLCEEVQGQPAEFTEGNIKIVRRGGRWTLNGFALAWRDPYDVCIESVAHAVPYFRGLLDPQRTIELLFHVHQSVVGGELGPFSRILVRGLEHSLRFQNARFAAISESTRNAAISVLKVKCPIRVIAPGVDCAKFSPGKKPAGPAFLYIGMLKKYKRVDHVIQALRYAGRDASLVIAGTGYDLPRLKSIAGSSPRIRFVGRVSEEEKIGLLRAATANVIASTEEGFGLSSLEAAACGTPTVAYDIGPLRESIVDGIAGRLVPNGDVRALGEAMGESMDHPEWGIAARGLALEHTWEASAQKFSDLVRSV
jgi:glycosyltransferase involved in cell wall biosynthesis